jgi:hypothetical protein
MSDPIIEGSNSLADLAARIRAFHEATVEGLRQSVTNGIAAGELLIEAKAQLQHGQWLPWLRDNVNISERTAQLYMRLAKNRTEIEAKSATVADLTLNEAAAVLMLSSDIKKLFAFMKGAQELNGEELIAFCAEHNVALFTNNPFGAKEWWELDDAELLEWNLWTLFGVKELGVSRAKAEYHTDRLQSRGWSLTEWYGEMGVDYRKRCGLREISQSLKDQWRAFLAKNQHREIADVVKEIETLNERFERDRAEARLHQPARKRRRR